LCETDRIRVHHDRLWQDLGAQRVALASIAGCAASTAASIKDFTSMNSFLSGNAPRVIRETSSSELICVACREIIA
jgi:hypothetical protein